VQFVLSIRLDSVSAAREMKVTVHTTPYIISDMGKLFDHLGEYTKHSALARCCILQPALAASYTSKLRTL